MTIIRLGVATAIAMAAPAANAATTIVFDTTAASTTNAFTQTVTSGAAQASFTGGVYSETTAAMNAAGGNVTLTARNVNRSATGLGVAGDGEANQVDSNGANELLTVVFAAPGQYRIVSATLGMVDSDDSFALFGGNGGVYARLGFTGSIAGGISGGIPVTRTNLGGGVYRLDFTYDGRFDSFRFGTNREDRDGFSLRSLAVAAVPEPSAWALLIVGFGLVGGALRRKTRTAAQGKAKLAFT